MFSDITTNAKLRLLFKFNYSL